LQIEHNWAAYRVFNLSLISNYPFPGYLQTGLFTGEVEVQPPEVVFACRPERPFPVNWEQGRLVFQSAGRTKAGESIASLFHFDTFDVLRFPGIADFYLGPDRIDCHVLGNANRLESVLSTVLAYWLERESLPVLHASALVIQDRAVAFAATSGSGKSTLAAAFLRAGYPLLSDDLLALESRADGFWGRPGLPRINLWPDQAGHFLGLDTHLKQSIPLLGESTPVPAEQASSGSFCDQPRPLACVYLPDRRDLPESGIEIQPLALAEAVIELVRNSCLIALVEKSGWQARRLELFSRLVQVTPVRRLLYPTGFEHLPQVTGAILNDLEELTVTGYASFAR
jgi:hypothetical protein